MLAGKVHEDLIDHNAEWAQSFAYAGLPTPPARKLAVVVCMDSRIDVFAALGLEIGEAHVIRNAGGIATDDVIRSLAISQRFLGTEAVFVIQHTRCGMQTFADDELTEEIELETGQRPSWRIGAFKDLDRSVRTSVAAIRQSPFVPNREQVWGFVYDVESGLLREVEAPPGQSMAAHAAQAD